jgi:peroxiredoxin
MSHPSELSLAPSFTLPSDRGEMVSLEALLAKGPLLLAFHRGTW